MHDAVGECIALSKALEQAGKPAFAPVYFILYRFSYPNYELERI
jgi:hypothetical protein